MRHPAFESLPRLILFWVVNLLAGLTMAICLIGLIPVSTELLLMDGVLFGLLSGLLTWLLWFAVALADLSGGQPTQRIINHSALLLLALLVWTGGGTFLEYLFFPSSSSYFRSAILLKTVYGFFLFLTSIRWYQAWRLRREQQQEEDEERRENAEESVTVSGQNKEMLVEPRLIQSVESSRTAIETVTVKNGQKIHVVAVPEILFIQAEGDYVLIHTPQGRFIKEQTMKYFDENLPASRFVRIHRSCIVNKEEISKIELYEKQSYRITLKTGHQLRASASGYKSLKSALNI